MDSTIQKTQQDSNHPTKRKKTSSTDTSDLPTTVIELSVLAYINNKLELLVTLHSEMKERSKSLEFAYEHIEQLKKIK